MTPAPQPEMLASVPGIVQQLRAEGTTVGWLQDARHCFTAQAVVGGRLVTFGSASDECQNETPSAWGIGSAGIPIWVATSPGNDTYGFVHAPPHNTEVTGSSAIADGRYVTAAAATGRTRAYAVLAETAADACYGQGSGPCVERVVPAASFVELVSPAGVRRLQLPALRLSAHDGHIAAVLADETLRRESPVASGVVEVLPQAVTVRMPDDRVDDVAVSSAGFVVRVGTTLYRFDPRARLLGRTAINHVARDLSMAGRRIVFRTRRVIRSIDVRTGRGGIVAVPKGEVLGVVAATDRRIVWAERAGSRSKIVALGLRR